MPVACSAGARGGCQGTLTLLSASPLANHKTIQLRLGTAAVSLAPGTTGEVTVTTAGSEDLAQADGLTAS